MVRARVGEEGDVVEGGVEAVAPDGLAAFERDSGRERAGRAGELYVGDDSMLGKGNG